MGDREGAKKQSIKKLVAMRLRLKLLAIQERSGGLVCICSDCQKVRDEQGYWSESGVDINKNPDIEFTHGFCPDCLSQRHLEIDDYLGMTRDTQVW